jgi:hypothetical protein
MVSRAGLEPGTARLFGSDETQDLTQEFFMPVPAERADPESTKMSTMGHMIPQRLSFSHLASLICCEAFSIPFL